MFDDCFTELGKTILTNQKKRTWEACACPARWVYTLPTALGCSQAVRHRFLVPACEGSNPSTPATLPSEKLNTFGSERLKISSAQLQWHVVCNNPAWHSHARSGRSAVAGMMPRGAQLCPYSSSLMRPIVCGWRVPWSSSLRPKRRSTAHAAGCSRCKRPRSHLPPRGG